MRNDRRTNKRGRGIAIFVKNDIPYRYLNDVITANIETCWIEIIKPKAKELLICSAYRPPDISLDRSLEDLELMLSNLPANSEVVLLGDFNVNFLGSTKQEAPQRSKLRRFANNHNLEQMIRVLTRVTETTKRSLIFCFQVIKIGLIVI